jgi:LSD1 subclass zinc finger protein
MDSPASSSAASQVFCQQCGAPLNVEQGTKYVTCSFCGATNFVDRRRAVFHYSVRPTLRPDDAQTALRRWMAGNATVKGLDQKSTLEQPVFEMFPMWLIRARQGGEERVLLEPAGALSVSELKRTAVPAADLAPYDHALDSVAQPVTVPYEMMLEWLQNDHRIMPAEIVEVSLVHLPIFICKYQFKGERYTAVVDAATSAVYANIFPAKWEVPYLTVALAAFATFFCAAWVPLAGFLTAETTGLGIGIGAYLLASCVFAIIFFGIASVISARV